MGSQPPSKVGPAPQQELPPVETRSAACPYFSLTTSLIFDSLMVHSYLQICTMSRGLTALLRVQHSEYKKPSSSCSDSIFAVYQRKVLSRRTLTRSSLLSFSR